ncbi:MAG: purine-nucleoside phosphorylase [Deltaproteobacteria bacterium]|nr:purine-nucleoside phosphorylase [Deltaproteobacteria bacterium]MBW1993975.1 purine-nucleoside phosphorylase [Deltaproteobacteria bacterium]
MKDFVAKVQEAFQFLKSRLEEMPKIAVITGTGLGAIGESFDANVTIDYLDVPHFPSPTVVSHRGMMRFGKMAHRSVVVMQGRVHLYEGYAPWQVTFSIRVLQALGVQNLILLNAAGGINPAFAPGDIMVIVDHINLTGSNPLVGPNVDQWGPRFPEMTDAYHKALISKVEKAATDAGVQIKRGVYAGLIGPCLETPAEVRFLRLIGCDAVGFSTVQEVIAAAHAKMKVVALSVITNVHDPEHPAPVRVEDVLKTAESGMPKIKAVLESVINSIDDTATG